MSSQHLQETQYKLAFLRHILLPEIGEAGQAKLCSTCFFVEDGADTQAAKVVRLYLSRAGLRESETATSLSASQVSDARAVEGSRAAENSSKRKRLAGLDSAKLSEDDNTSESKWPSESKWTANEILRVPAHALTPSKLRSLGQETLMTAATSPSSVHSAESDRYASDSGASLRGGGIPTGELSWESATEACTAWLAGSLASVELIKASLVAGEDDVNL